MNKYIKDKAKLLLEFIAKVFFCSLVKKKPVILVSDLILLIVLYFKDSSNTGISSTGKRSRN